MPSTQDFGSLRHLAGRFFGALLPMGPPQGDEQWAQDHLLPGENTLWRAMSGADRRHAVGVARRTVTELASPGESGGPGAPGDSSPGDDPAVSRDVVAAALLHDVGKIEAGLGTWARAGVTFAAMATGRAKLVDWSGAATADDGSGSGRRSWRQRVGLYLSHDRVGASLLVAAGSDPLTVAWTAEHHQPPERWSVDARVATALKVADDD